MKTASGSGVEAGDSRRVLVWDAPVRMFHWLVVLSFATAWLTAESERWRLVHVTAGYTVAGLVAFRLVWGFLGTRHARFSAFVRGPRAAMGYLRSLLCGRPEHHAGHNPAAALAIVGLLALAVLTTASGWGTYAEVAGEWLEEAHEVLASSMLALVGVHVLAVFASSWLHHENLVASMVHGRKRVPPREGIRRSWASVAAALLVAAAGFWWLQWDSAPAGTLLPGESALSRGDDRDDPD